MKNIIHLIAACFAANPNVQKLHVCEDGNCFPTAGYADWHARSNKLGKVKVVDRDDKEVVEAIAAHEASEKERLAGLDAKAKQEADEKKAYDAKIKADAEAEAAKVKAAVEADLLAQNKAAEIKEDVDAATASAEGEAPAKGKKK